MLLKLLYQKINSFQKRSLFFILKGMYA